MVKQGGGQVVNTSSVAGKGGYPLRTYYCASKHALIGLMDCLRFEVSLDINSVFVLEPLLKHVSSLSLSIFLAAFPLVFSWSSTTFSSPMSVLVRSRLVSVTVHLLAQEMSMTKKTQ